MKVTAADVARIPVENLTVTRTIFAALWMTAEHLHEERAHQRVWDWYSAGVATTCRWLAKVTVHPQTGPAHLARSPITNCADDMSTQLIESEYREAVKLAVCQPKPAWLEQRPGWIQAIEATLHWVRHQDTTPPLQIDHNLIDHNMVD